jgi:hypothetical protein
MDDPWEMADGIPLANCFSYRTYRWPTVLKLLAIVGILAVREEEREGKWHAHLQPADAHVSLDVL